MRSFLADIRLSEHDTFRQNDNNNLNFAWGGNWFSVGLINKNGFSLQLNDDNMCSSFHYLIICVSFFRKRRLFHRWNSVILGVDL